MRPPVTMPLDEIMMQGKWLSLIFFDASAPLDRFANQCCHGGTRIVGWVLAISVGRFHHQNIRSLTFRGSGMDHFAGRNFPVTHAADVAGKEQMARLPIDF